MKKTTIYLLSGFALLLAVVGLYAMTHRDVFAATPALTTTSGGTGTTTPSGILYGDSTIRLKTVTIGSGLTFSAGTLSASGGAAAGYDFSYDQSLGYGITGSATSTVTKFTIGLIASSTSYFSNASTTLQTIPGSLWLTGLTTGGLAVDGNGLVYKSATTTAGTGLTYSGNAFNVNNSQSIATLLNLTTDGFVLTSGANGTLGVQAFPATVAQGGSGAVTLTGVLLGNGTSAFTAGSTQTCTNQFVRAMSSAYAATCATVGAADVSLANLTATDSSLTFSGTYTGATARTIGLNLGNANTWTALQTFGNASTTQISSTGSAYFATASGNVGIASSSPAFRLSIGDVASQFYIDSAGKVVAYDTTNAWEGRVSPTRSFVLGSGTTTTWTASTTNSAYSPFIQMPFTGTLRQARCGTDASFLGVNVVVAGSNATPSYFVASTTIGKVAFTAGNTFTAGQKILANFGTTTTATAQSISCTFDVTETP